MKLMDWHWDSYYRINFLPITKVIEHWLSVPIYFRRYGKFVYPFFVFGLCSVQGSLWSSLFPLHRYAVPNHYVTTTWSKFFRLLFHAVWIEIDSLRDFTPNWDPFRPGMRSKCMEIPISGHFFHMSGVNIAGWRVVTPVRKSLAIKLFRQSLLYSFPDCWFYIFGVQFW